MLHKALPFLRQLLRWSLTHGIEELSLCGGAREEFPRPLTLQRALCEALVARGPQPAATCIPEGAALIVVSATRCSRSPWRRQTSTVVSQQCGSIGRAVLGEV